MKEFGHLILLLFRLSASPMFLTCALVALNSAGGSMDLLEADRFQILNYWPRYNR